MKKFWIVLHEGHDLIAFSSYRIAKEKAEVCAKDGGKYVILEAMEYCKLNDIIWKDCEEKEIS